MRERYALAVDKSSLGVWDWSVDTHELYWSPGFYRIIGADPAVPPSVEELMRRIPPEDRDRARAAMNNVQDRFDLEHRVVHDSGEVRWVRARGHVIHGADGEMIRTAGVLADITMEVDAREFRREVWAILAELDQPVARKIQHALELAAKRLHLAFGGIARIDGELCEFLYQVHPEGSPPLAPASPRSETISSVIYDAGDLLAIPDMAASRFADMPAHRVSGIEAFIGAPLVVVGRPYGAIWLAGREKRAQFSDWEESIVLLLAQAVGRELGRATHVQALRDSEQRFLLATRAARVGITEWQEDDWETQYWSDNFYRMLGYEPGEIPAKMSSFIPLIHPDDAAAGKASLESYDEDTPTEVVFRLRHKTKGYRWFHATAASGRDSDGRLRMVGSIMDVHDLKVAQERAQAANVAKTQFLATMSHEIRTPLNGILGMAAALSRTRLEPGQQSMLNVIRESGSALLQVINQILDLSKIESGKYALDHETFVLEDLVGALGAMHELKAQEKGLRFTVDVAPEARGPYEGDPGRLRQILNNLVANAVKFTECGFVSLAVTMEGAAGGAVALRFDVRDSGPGMTEAERGKLFTPFTQLDSSSTRRHEGTGLGLAISQRLAEMMGGGIDVESVHGEGSTFSLRVSLSRAAPPQASEPAEEKVVPLFGGGRPVRVLSVDDHPTNRLVLEALLQPTGALVTSVESGAAALEALEGGGFDIILLDIQMPDMDGPATLAEIRRRERDKNLDPTPIIAVTANALTHQIEGYLRTGFDGHIAKPIAVEELVQVVAAAARRRPADASARGAARTGRDGAA